MMRQTASVTLIWVILAASTVGLSGCPAADVAAATTVLQTALSDLTQNRALAEQFVRDVKASVPPADPLYVQAMESYQDAREIYNRYLDSTESDSKQQNDRSLRGCSPRDVENAAADFLADATQALKPKLNTRKIAFQRAIMIPEDLRSTLSLLPKKARQQITNNFDEQVRWRKWSEL